MLRLGRREFGPHEPVIMAIVNRTPDSFYDQGATFDDLPALERVDRAVAEGAAIVDIGGVKAGPGDEVDAAEEARRTVGFVARVRERHPDVVISVDTWRHEVGEAVCEAGADVLNDAWGGVDPKLAVNTATGEIVGDDDTDESPENGEASATPGESDGPDTGGGTGPSTPESRGTVGAASGSEGEGVSPADRGEESAGLASSLGPAGSPGRSPADGPAQGDGPPAEPVEGPSAGSGEAEPGAERPGGPLAAGLPQDEPAPQETAPAPPALGLPQDGPRSHGDARTARVPGEGDAAPIQGVAPQPAQREAAPGEGVAAGQGGNSPGPHPAAGSPDGGAAGQTGDPGVSGPAEQERPGDRTAPDGGPDQAPPQTAPKNRGQQT